MHMLGHHDKVVQSIVSFTPVVLEGFEEELAVGNNLKESLAIVGHRCDKECSRMCGSWRGRHRRDFIAFTSGAEAL